MKSEFPRLTVQGLLPSGNMSVGTSRANCVGSNILGEECK
jgi:hypothetical protein